METEELVGRMQQADGLKQAVLAARASRAEARKSSKQAGASQSAVQRALQQANARLAELQSGRGAKLAAATHATVYEFWIEVPGYSGPVRGTTARVTQHGDIQHVSNVQGQTKGGLGGAVVGGALFGVGGAIVGSNVGRKTTVKTEVKQVDTRTFELEITGPGFAWSTVAGPAAESSFMQFRDTVNARGSSTDDVGAFTAAQTAHVAALGQSSEQAALTAQSAASTATDLAAEYDGAWSAYANARLPLVQELACRWATSPIPSRAGIIVAGPTILLALVAWLGIAMSNGEASMPLRAIGVYLVLLVGACLAYLYKVRLVK